MKYLHPRAKLLFFLQNFVGLFVVFGGGLIWLAVGVDSVSNAIGTEFRPDNWWIYLIIELVVILGLSWLFAWLGYINYRYELGERGFQKEYGIIWKRYVTIPYTRIQNVDIHRGVFARMLGLSDLMIQTAGHAGNQTALSEGRLPAVSKEEAVTLRDELVRRLTEPAAKQGL